MEVIILVLDMEEVAAMKNPERYHVLLDAIFLGELSLILGYLLFINADTKP